MKTCDTATLKSFTTHTGETVTGAKLRAALEAYAIETRRAACELYLSNPYADHILETEKASEVMKSFEYAEDIAQGRLKRGGLTTLSARQSLNTILTGECVPLLGKTPDGAQPKLQAKEDGDE